MGTFLLSRKSLNVITVKLFCIIKDQFLKNLCSGTHRGGFQFLLIWDLWGKSFHAAVVFGLGKNLLFKSILGHCVVPLPIFRTSVGSTVRVPYHYFCLPWIRESSSMSANICSAVYIACCFCGILCWYDIATVLVCFWHLLISLVDN